MRKIMQGVLIAIAILVAILAIGVVSDSDRELYELEHGNATVHLINTGGDYAN